MKVLEIMERAGTRDTNLAIAFIKDAFHLMQSQIEVDLDEELTSIVDGTREYALPKDMISLISVSVLNENTDKYERISRLSGKPTLQSDESP